MSRASQSKSEGDREIALASELVGAGADTAGAAAGGALGLIGGPAGVMAGAVGGVAATRVIRRVGAQIQLRLTGPRAHRRAGEAFAVAVDDIATALAVGQSLRTDGFFPSKSMEHSDADEVLEGVLKAASDAHEERKVPYLGHLFASIAFDPRVTPAYANFLVRLAETITWRQLVLLTLFRGGNPRLFARGQLSTEPPAAVLAEVDDLGNRGLIGLLQEDDFVSRPSATFGGGRPTSETLGRFRTTELGERFAELARVDLVPKSDLGAAESSVAWAVFSAEERT